VKNSDKEFSLTTALIIAAQLNEKPNSVIGTAAGSTTTDIHKELVELYQQNVITFKDAYIFVKDADLPQGESELPMSADNPHSQYYEMFNLLIKHIDIPLDHFFTPDPTPANPDETMKLYLHKINSLGGIDLQVISVGQPGYIGFNFPGVSFSNEYTIVDEPESLQSFAPYYGVDNVPSLGMSLGLKSLMMARKIVLCAKGLAKADMIAKALKGPVTESIPASVFQLHPNLTVVLDKEAASKL